MRNYIIACICILLVACNKSSNNNTPANSGTEMPKPTTSGANVLACKVDGVVHVYSGIPAMLNNQKGVQYIGPTSIKLINGYQVHISANDPTNYNDYLSLNIVYPDSNLYPRIGVKYYLSNYSSPLSKYIKGNSDEYYADTSKCYVLFTRADSLVVSGSFEYSGSNNKSSKVVLSEGIFDVMRAK